ncbi:MAG: hypothetical protein GX421_12565, partial [Caldisericales bacterium]|nr:hypothetical protein [Caldisericales bacterium]
MAKTLSTNISTGKTGASEPVYLVSMSLDNSTSLLLATKDTNDITGWSGSRYLGGYLETLGTIDMLIDLAKGPGVHKTYDFEYSLLNQDDFHESLLQYDFYNRAVEIRLIFADKESPSWANAVPLFKGIIRDWSYSKQRIVIKCTSNDKVWLERQLPLTVFNADQFPHCPSGNLGKPIPLIWGEYAEPDGLYQAGGDLVKAYKIDDKFNIYMASSHALQAYRHAYYWNDNLKEACKFSGVVDGAYTFTGAAVASYYWVYDPRITIISRILSLMDAVSGNDFETDGDKVFDFSISTSIRLSKASNADKLLARLADMKVDGASAIYLCHESAWSNTPNLFDRIRIFIYADNFEATAFVDSYFGADHDIYETDWDVTATWKASSKSNIGIRVSFEDGGSNNYCDLMELLVRVEDAGIDTVPDWILVPPNARMFDAWIDYTARNNDLGQWGVIVRGSYVIESVLHEIGLDQDEIDYEAFDAIAGSSSADRYDWKLAGQLAVKSTVRDLLSEMALQNAAIIFEDCQGKLTIKALNT